MHSTPTTYRTNNTTASTLTNLDTNRTSIYVNTMLRCFHVEPSGDRDQEVKIGFREEDGLVIYDIHTEKAAQETLVRLTGIPISLWESNIYRERDYELQDYFVEAMIEEHGTKQLPLSYTDMDFVYFHVTTSANECRTIRAHGILDLKNAYLCEDSELRLFLDDHGIFIDLDRAVLKYRNREYDIHYQYGRSPRWNEPEEVHNCWSIGRKFYYDFTTCGFLSVWDKNPYGGGVHRRPEILSDIDTLLEIHLSEEWERTHEAYEIVAKVSGKNICYFSDDEESDEEKVMAYVVMAYNAALNGLSEETLLMKNGVQIQPEDILEIKPLTHWH